MLVRQVTFGKLHEVRGLAAGAGHLGCMGNHSGINLGFPLPLAACACLAADYSMTAFDRMHVLNVLRSSPPSELSMADACDVSAVSHRVYGQPSRHERRLGCVPSVIAKPTTPPSATLKDTSFGGPSLPSRNSPNGFESPATVPCGAFFGTGIFATQFVL
jgi:hypothetical protein